MAKSQYSEIGFFSKSLTEIGVWLARPSAFLIVIFYAIVWFVADRSSFGWHGILTIITLCVALIIQRSEHRDTQAIHAKLDELLRATEGAREGLKHVDKNEPEKIEAVRDGL